MWRSFADELEAVQARWRGKDCWPCWTQVMMIVMMSRLTHHPLTVQTVSSLMYSVEHKAASHCLQTGSDTQTGLQFGAETIKVLPEPHQWCTDREGSEHTTGSQIYTTPGNCLRVLGCDESNLGFSRVSFATATRNILSLC